MQSKRCKDKVKQKEEFTVAWGVGPSWWEVMSTARLLVTWHPQSEGRDGCWCSVCFLLFIQHRLHLVEWCTYIYKVSSPELYPLGFSRSCQPLSLNHQSELDLISGTLWYCCFIHPSHQTVEDWANVVACLSSPGTPLTRGFLGFWFFCLFVFPSAACRHLCLPGQGCGPAHHHKMPGPLAAYWP